MDMRGQVNGPDRDEDHDGLGLGLRPPLDQILALLCLPRHPQRQPTLLYMPVSLHLLLSIIPSAPSLPPFRMPFVEPTTSRTCSHSFCRACIDTALQASSHCPIDRSPLSPRDMVPSNPIIRHVRTRSYFSLFLDYNLIPFRW
jgi:C3HC4-type zinc finger (RING finger) protein